MHRSVRHGARTSGRRPASVYAYGGGPTWRLGAETTRGGSVWPEFTRDFETKVHQGIYTKVVDLLTLYNFYKGRQMFWSTVFAWTAGQVGRFSWRWWTVTGGVDHKFSHIYTSNSKCHSTWKLCPSTNCTTFTLEEFEVFRRNMESAAKVLEWTWMSMGLGRGLLGFDKIWPSFDQRFIIRACWLGFRGDGLGWPMFDQSQHVWLDH
jgi:hypothetical protein